MARKLPLPVLIATGSAARNPGRVLARAAEVPANGDVGPAPSHLDAASRAVWTAIASDAHAGTLGRADRLVLELLCTQVARARERNWQVAAPVMLRIESLLGRLGLTPADRARVAVAPGGPAADRTARFFTDD